MLPKRTAPNIRDAEPFPELTPAQVEMVAEGLKEVLTADAVPDWKSHSSDNCHLTSLTTQPIPTISQRFDAPEARVSRRPVRANLGGQRR